MINLLCKLGLGLELDLLGLQSPQVSLEVFWGKWGPPVNQG